MEIKREDIEAIYDQGKEVMVDFVMNLIREFTAKIDELTERVNELENKLAKNSKNSSKPPSSDGLKKIKRTQSQRKKTGKKSGGQHGHAGKTLEMRANPDKVKKLCVKTCACCGTSLMRTEAKGYESRQKFEIPKPEVKVTEYRAEIKDCPNCGKSNKAVFPEDITHKTQYGNYLRSIAVYFNNYELIPIERTAEIFEDIFNVPLSEGTIITALTKCAIKLIGYEEWVIDKIKHSRAVNFDESGVNIGGTLHWMHSAGTSLLSAYFVHKKRGSEAFDAMGILPDFQGIAIHDHWSAYFKYTCRHALCNAHHLRELTFAYEQDGQKWAKEMIDCLLEIKASVDKEKVECRLIDKELMRQYEKKYQKIIRQGLKMNPFPEEEIIKKRGRKKKTKTINLLIRLRDFSKETLGFMYDLDIPFDNNLAERDIRMIKVQQKISGLFRTISGAEKFCRIRSFIATVKKQRLNVIDAICQIMNGNQIYENFILNS